MDRHFRVLRRQCEARLHDLDLPVPFDLERFCGALIARRGRPISLRPITAQPGPYGMWAATATTDYIFYEEHTSPLHRLHIILHELSHIICEHRPVPMDELSIPADLFPNLHSDTIRLLLQRAVYSTDEEPEAELLATLLLARVTGNPPKYKSPDDPEAGGVLHRLANSLEHEDLGRT
jgi:hypothetical protein